MIVAYHIIPNACLKISLCIRETTRQAHNFHTKSKIRQG